MGKGSNILPKRRIGIISQGADQVPTQAHELVRMSKGGFCMYYKELKYRDGQKSGLR